MKRLLALVLLLVALAVAADRVAVHVAERVLAGQLETQLGTRPAVDIEGFPFLTQAVSGTYDALQVSAPRAERGGIVLEDVSAHLTGVHLALSAVLHGEVSEVPVDRLTATGLLTYATLQSLAGRTGLTVGPADGGVLVSGTVRVLGQDVAASAVSDVRLTGSSVTVTARSVEVDGAVASGALGRALAGRLDLTVPLPALPYDATVTGIEPGARGVTVSGSSTGLVLRR